MLQWQAHRTVYSLTVLPVSYDLTRRSTVGIWEERERGRVEGGERRTPIQNISLAILGHMEKQEMKIKWKLETGNWEWDQRTQ